MWSGDCGSLNACLVDINIWYRSFSLPERKRLFYVSFGGSSQEIKHNDTTHWDCPVHLFYSTYGRRLLPYACWHSPSKQKPDKLSEAGFFFADKSMSKPVVFSKCSLFRTLSLHFLKHLMFHGSLFCYLSGKNDQTIEELERFRRPMDWTW